MSFIYNDIDKFLSISVHLRVNLHMHIKLNLDNLRLFTDGLELDYQVSSFVV